MALPHRQCVEQEMQPGGQGEGHGEADETDDRDREVAHADHPAAVGGGDGALVRGPQSDRQSVEHDGEAKADQQRVLHPYFLVGAHHEAKERDVERQAQQQGERDDQHEGGERVQAKEGEEPERPVPAQHDQLPVGDVEDLEDAEDKRQPHGRQSVQAHRS